MKNLFIERIERSEHGLETHLSMSQKYGLVADLGEKRMLSESYAGGKLCYKDDIVLNRLKAHLGVFALASQNGVISPDYTVLKPIRMYISPQFAEYYLKSDACKYELRKRVRGVVEGFWRLYTEDLYTINMQIPPREEQDQIVRYLDWKVSRINKLVNNKRRKIELLGEQKRTVVNESVEAQREHRKMKYLLRIRSGDALTNNYLSDDNTLFPVYGGGKLIGYYPQANANEKNILIGRVGANCGCVTRPYSDCWATDNALIIQTDENLSYLKYLLWAADLNRLNESNAQPLITGSKVMNHITPYTTNTDEQHKIVAYLDEQCARINNVIDKLNEEITLFTEFRTRLISDVVTGKLDVRDVVVPEHNRVDDVTV